MPSRKVLQRLSRVFSHVIFIDVYVKPNNLRHLFRYDLCIENIPRRITELLNQDTIV